MSFHPTNFLNHKIHEFLFALYLQQHPHNQPISTLHHLRLQYQLDFSDDILDKSNWEITEERVLLGRNIWKRQNGYKLKPIETELLSSLVGNLQQQPELPSTIQIEKNK